MLDQTVVQLPVLEIFNVCTDINACDCMWPNTTRETARKADFGNNSLATPGIRTCVSGIPGLTLIQLSYIPASIGLISDQ